jgi:hypothetical protein
LKTEPSWAVRRLLETHGDPIKLTGGLADDTLTFSGDSSGENFTIHIDSTGSLKEDGTLAGTLKAHFVDFNDAHQVVRTRDQEIPWTATRTSRDRALPSLGSDVPSGAPARLDND